MVLSPPSPQVHNEHFSPPHAGGVPLRAGETWVRTCKKIDDAQSILADSLVWCTQGGVREYQTGEDGEEEKGAG